MFGRRGGHRAVQRALLWADLGQVRGDGESSPRCAPNDWPPEVRAIKRRRRHPSLVGKSSLERSSERPQPVTSHPKRGHPPGYNTTSLANINSAKGSGPGSKHPTSVLCVV